MSNFAWSIWTGFRDNKIIILLAILLFLSGFLYGYGSHKFQLTPHSYIRETFDRFIQNSWFRSAWLPIRGLLNSNERSLQYWRSESPGRRDPGGVKGVGYFSGYERGSDTSGVVRHDSDRANGGLNLVVSGHEPSAVLMDMDGTVLHRWSMKWERAFPDKTPYHRPGREKTTFWRRVRVLPDGGLIAIYQGQGIIRLDRHSNLQWARFLKPQNDLHVRNNGDIYTITKKFKTIPSVRTKKKMEEYFITTISPTGEIKHRVSLVEALNRSHYSSILSTARQGPAGVFHTNTVHFLDRVPETMPDGFRKGNLLISFPTLNTIAVLDPDSERITWLMSNMFRYQHSPTLLHGGNLMVFDNLGHQGFSRVIEFDPASQKIHWGYYGTEENGFRSRCCGVSQRLSNGNTLITDTTGGRAFELTEKKEVAWEYVNPHRSGSDDALVASLFQVQRIPRSYFTTLPSLP